MIYNNILETIGNTPVVRLNRMGPDHVELYVKVESFNPMASVKDRLAFAIINDAERRGTLAPGQTVIEATSGNTGIALAMVCAAKGHPFVATMAESFSIERRKIMRGLGAKVILTPAAERGSGMVKKAEELAAKHGWFLTRQFENPANPEYHRHTTGPEILRDFAGRPLDYWVTGYGTGGTMTGAGEVIKAARPNVRIVVTEPEGAALLAGKEWQPHKIQGWTPDFIPDVLDREVFDELRTVSDERAIAVSRELAVSEGIFTGISAGGTLATALDVAEEAPAGSAILAMLPDTGERYLSTPLFEDIPAEMSEEEIEISMSTPNFRFGAAPPPAPDKEEGEETVAPPADAVAFLEESTHDDDNPVVLFALEWCEFCWSVRKMFAHYDIPYRSVDLDSVAYQDDNWGGKIRKAIEAATGLKTIPQIYIGGKHVGGATDLFDGIKDGSVQALLEANKVNWNREADRDPYSFLPKWLHKR